MARTRSTNSVTSTDEKITVEATTTTNEETKVEEKTTEKTPETTENTEVKQKVIKDDDEIAIKCISLAGKSVICSDPKNPILFDEKGVAKVIGKDAKKLLSIPGYEIAK